jgi:hypothetical protein
MVTEGKQHELRQTRQMRLAPGTILVYDRSYMYYDWANGLPALNPCRCQTYTNNRNELARDLSRDHERRTATQANERSEIGQRKWYQNWPISEPLRAGEARSMVLGSL